MPDTKEGREEQASAEERRQRERELAEARERADEPEPPSTDEERGDGEPQTCDRRDCDEPAAFGVLERYQEGSGHGAVEAEALLCRAHAAEERPTNLDGVYPDYVFRVEPLPGAVD